MATDPIMCMVIWLGTRLPSTTILPNHASKRSKMSTPTDRKYCVPQMFRRDARTLLRLRANANTGKPAQGADKPVDDTQSRYAPG